MYRYHHGTNGQNMRFHQAYPLFKDGIVGPMKDFAIDVFKQNHPHITTTKSDSVIQSSPPGPTTTTSSVITPAFTPTSADLTSMIPPSIDPTFTASTTSIPTSAGPSTCSFPTFAQSMISDDLIDPSLFGACGVPEPTRVDIRTLMCGGPLLNMADVFNESSTVAKVDDSSVGNKRKAVEIEAESQGNQIHPPPAKRKKAKTKTKAVTAVGSEALPSIISAAESEGTSNGHPSRANAGGKYKTVREQVKKGKGRAKKGGKAKM